MLDRPAPSQRDRLDMYNANALKLGLFGANCSSGRSATKVPERWSASWEDCLALARMGDDAGIDFMLPIGRWKGYGGDTDLHGETLETITWATGLLAATSRITVFGTVHAPLFHPIIAAKQCVTADHVGEGRFGLNIVAGWNEGEFEMFGVQQREHEARYAYAQEWIDAIKLAWDRGRRLRLRRRAHQAEESPRQAEALRRHAAADHERRLVRRRARPSRMRNCDAFFTATSTSRQGVDATAKMVADIKAEARAHRPRDRGVHHRPDRLPPDPEGGRGLLPPRHHRAWPTGARSSSMMEIKNLTPADARRRRRSRRSATISRRARSAAIRSSARPTASPTSSPP